MEILWGREWNLLVVELYGGCSGIVGSVQRCSRVARPLFSDVGQGWSGRVRVSWSVQGSSRMFKGVQTKIFWENLKFHLILTEISRWFLKTGRSIIKFAQIPPQKTFQELSQIHLHSHPNCSLFHKSNSVQRKWIRKRV